MARVSKATVANRYLKARSEAFQATYATLRDAVPEFRLAEFTNASNVAWRTQWAPVNDRAPPEGGWDWPDVKHIFRKRPDRLEIAVFSGDRLAGMAICTLSGEAVHLQAVEADPAAASPLAGKILLIVLQVAASYAQRTGRAEVRIVDPADGLVRVYCDDYGFALEKPRGKKQYCYRKV